jgi:hypothetical protein
MAAVHPKPPFEARGKETSKRLSGRRGNCYNRNYNLQFRCQIGNLRPPCICDPLPAGLSRKQPGTATNSQVLCCFRRRMPIENPASLRRTTDTWLISCCKKQQKQPERGSAPKNETRCRKAESRSSACAGWRASAAPAITASGRPAPRVGTTPRRATRSSGWCWPTAAIVAATATSPNSCRRDPQRAGNAASMPPAPRGRCPRAERA